MFHSPAARFVPCPLKGTASHANRVPNGTVRIESRPVDQAVIADEEFTPRQQAVLDCALQLLVGGGEKGLTTAGLARAANCSKESIYKWFGDRDGLLTATVQWQAAKVRMPRLAGTLNLLFTA